MTTWDYVLLAVIAYFIGSIPSAFLILKIKTKKDIRQMGSGNIGAFNALRTSKSKWVGIVVLLMDFFKGFVPTWYFLEHYQYDALSVILLANALLVGHVYSLWMKFKGGRGLAVLAGAVSVIQPLMLLFWLVVWAVMFALIRKHIVASLVATFALPLFVYFTLNIYFTPQHLLMILPATMLIFLKHLERLPDLVEEKKQKIIKGE